MRASAALSGTAALFLALLPLSPAGAVRSCPPERVREAIAFAYPVYEMVRTRRDFFERRSPSGPVVANRFYHRPRLSDHRNREVTTPNNDTLYSAAWLDLAGGPVALQLPAAGDRYQSVALMDLFTDHFAILHPDRSGATTYWLAGPGWRGQVPPGARLVRAPMNDAWAVVRTFVAGDEDMAAARAVQTGVEVTSSPPPPRPFRSDAPPVPSAAELIDAVNESLGRGPLPSVHAGRVERFACAGVRPGWEGAWQHLSPRLRREWAEGLPAFVRNLRAAGLQESGRTINGWSYPAQGIGEFGLDDLFRSQVALQGLAALPVREAIYLPGFTDAAGARMTGSNAYRLRIPADVPAEAFWSVSMYEVDQEGRLFFTGNPVGRYAIGSRTEGLERARDGSVTLIIQSCRPPEAAANWLPAPPGPFALTFRAYRPGPALRNGGFRLPGVEPLGRPVCAPAGASG